MTINTLAEFLEYMSLSHCRIVIAELEQKNKIYEKICMNKYHTYFTSEKKLYDNKSIEDFYNLLKINNDLLLYVKQFYYHSTGEMLLNNTYIKCTDINKLHISPRCLTQL